MDDKVYHDNGQCCQQKRLEPADGEIAGEKIGCPHDGDINDNQEQAEGY